MPQAYLLDIRKLQSKNLVHRGIDFYVQNALTNHLRASLITKIFPGVTRTPVKGREWKRRGSVEKEGDGRQHEGSGRGRVMAVGIDAPGEL